MTTAAGGTVDYAKAIDGLSLNQAKLLLNMQKVDKQKQNSLLLDEGLISSNERMHAKHVDQALAAANLDTAEKNRILNNLNLWDKKEKTLKLSGECTEAALREELAMTALNNTEKDTIVTQILGTGANAGYTISWEALTASIWENIAATAKWLVTNPIGWIILTTTAIAALTAGYDFLISRKEKLAKQKLESINEDIKNIDEEISKLEDLQAKLEEAKGNKSELTKIQNELNAAIGETPGLIKGEEKAYEAANAKLKAQIELKKQQKEQLEADKLKTSRDLFDNKTQKVVGALGDWSATDQTADKMRQYAKKYNEFIKEYYNNNPETSTDGVLNLMKEFDELPGYLTTEDWINYWNEQVQTAYDAFDNVIQNYDGLGGQAFVKNLIDTLVRGGADFSEISMSINDIINSNGLQKSIDEYWDSLLNPKSSNNSQKALDNIKSKIEELKEIYPQLTNFFDDFYKQVTTSSKFISKTLSKDADNIENSIKRVEGTFESINAALESENAGKIYDSMLDNLEKAVELYKKGLLGTDDFKEITQWMTPYDIPVNDISAYKKAFEDSYELVKDWFNKDDPAKGMWSFIDDLNAKAPELFSDIDKKSGKVTFNLKNSAKAVEVLGVNVNAVDAIFRKLQEHGFDFGEDFFSGELENEYNKLKNELDNLGDSLVSDNTRNRLKNILGSFRDEIDEITKSRIIDIEFHVSQAQLIAEIEKLEKQAVETGGSTVQYGSLNYNKRELLEGYEEKSTYDENSKDYNNVKDQIAKLQKELSQATTEETKMAIQKQISALYDFLIDFQMRDLSGDQISFSDFLKEDSFAEIIKIIESSDTETKEAVEKVLQSAFEDLDIDELYNQYVSTKLEEISNSKAGELTFTAIVEGEEHSVTAAYDIKKGKIVYQTVIDGEIKTLEDFNEDKIDPKTGMIVMNVEVTDTENKSENGILKFFIGIWTSISDFFKNNPIKVATQADVLPQGQAQSAGRIGSVPDSKNQKQADGRIKADGTAHSSGTAISLWNNYRESTGQAYGGGHWGLYNNERALINELGSEIIVRNGKWFTVNNGYPAFADLKKGDIIFNHKQSEALLKNGYVTGSHAKMIGSSFAGGNAYSNPSYVGGYLPTTNYNAPGATINNAPSDKETKETFNWIETALSRIQSKISNLSKKVSATWRSWGERNTALKDQITAVNRELELQAQARAEYAARANAVGLDDYHKRLVEEGAINIETIEDESTIQKIKEYQEWYEKMSDCDDKSEELYDTLADLAQIEFDNLAKQFEDQNTLIEHEISLLEATADLLETRGYVASKSIYQSLIQNEQERKATKQSARDALWEKLNNSGLEKGSEQWNKMYFEVLDLNEEIVESQNKIAGLNNKLQELDWEMFDIGQEKISALSDEADFLIDLMSDEKLFNDDGSATKYGQATLGLQAQNYNIRMLQADDYAKELEKLEKQLEKDPNNLNLQKKKQELKELKQEAILDALEISKSIKDNISKSYDALLDSMDKIIDKRKEMLSQVKDLYDYEKSIKEQTAEVTKYQKIIGSMQGMADTEEGKTLLQKYELSLKEAQEHLEETEYDKYISDQEKLLDMLHDETKSWLDERLDNLDRIIKEVIDATNANASQIKSTLDAAAKEVGSDLSDEMTQIWGKNGEFTSVVTTYSEKFTDEMTTIHSTLLDIKKFVSDMMKDSDQFANETLSNASTPAPAPAPAPAPSAPPAPAPAPAPKAISVGGQINAGGAPIYTQAGGTKGLTQHFKNDPVYTVLSERNGYLLVRHHSLSSGYTGWFKKSDVTAYKTGGLVNETGFAWLDGTKEKPELVLNAKDTDNFLKLREALSQTSLNPSLNQFVHHPRFPRSAPDMKTQNITAHNGDIHIELPNVRNAQEFAEQFKEIYDKNISRTRTMLQTDMFSKNNLEYRRYL